ncbi:MAG: hypothetical protein ABW133_19685, partial [Polyangiaceae bacterium]
MRPLTLETANEELRQARRELTREGNAPLRLVVAGDPTKPVFSITVPRRLPTAIAAIMAVAGVAAAVHGYDGPAKARAALSSANLYAEMDESHRDEPPASNPALSASA